MHRVIAGGVALLVVCSGAGAYAEEPEEEPGGSEPVDATGAGPAFDGMRGPVFVPTAGVTFMMEVSPGPYGGAGISVPVWLGMSMHPHPSRLSPFSAVGVEINLRSDGADGRYAEIVPELRTGLALLRSPVRRYTDVMFPDLDLYAIFGWRMRDRFRPNGGRFGIGITSPHPLLLGMSMRGRGCFPFPTTLEGTVDVDRHGPPRYSVRFGYQF